MKNSSPKKSKKILKFMKKKLAFFIAVLYNKSCVKEAQ